MSKVKTKINMAGWKMWEHGVPDSFYFIPEDAEPEKIGAKIYWPAICKCGIKKLVEGTKLRSGHTKSCGCKKTIGVDLTNKTFTYLTALYPTAERRYNNVVWHCRCKCGNETDVTVAALHNGLVRSCGCLQKESVAMRQLKLEGQTINNIYVIAKDEKYVQQNNIKDTQHTYWKCRCFCGKEFTVIGKDLTGGHTRSCGCLLFKNSIGEQNIKQILEENNIQYIYNKEYFKDLILDKGKPGRYDFIILENNKPIRIIEFDGQQHFHENNLFAQKNGFEQIQRYDNLKNEYARTHNIPLVRIPYKERDHITLDLIMGDKYLVL